MRSNVFRTNPSVVAALSALSVLVGASAAWGEAGKSPAMRVIIEQALDQPVDIAFKDKPLSDAFKMIGEETGVKLVIQPEAVDLLPYGRETRVSATIKNVSLRDGLIGMLNYIGMTLRVGDSDVAIEPIDPLRRICRRATWTELKTLHTMLTTPFSPDAAAKLPFQFQIRTSTNAQKELLDEAAKVGAGTLAEVIEAACNQLDWTWYPWDNSLVVLTWREQADRFVDKPISLRYNHAALADVLTDLARQAGLKLRLEPGVLKGLPLQTRQNFSLMMQQATIRTALEMISATTGLGYEVTPKELIIRHTKDSRIAATQSTTVIRSQDPIVGEIAVGGKAGVQFKFFIRESHLTPELNDWREEQIRKAVKQMGQELKR